MASIEVVPATAAHIVELRRNLRDGDKNEILRAGWCVRDALWRCLNNTLEPKTALIDGAVAGAWGCEGTVLGYKGVPWLLTAKIAEKYPLQYALLFRAEVRKMLERYDVLENYVDASYDQAIKLLEMVGFSVYDPEPYGRNGASFRKFRLAV